MSYISASHIPPKVAYAISTDLSHIATHDNIYQGLAPCARRIYGVFDAIVASYTTNLINSWATLSAHAIGQEDFHRGGNMSESHSSYIIDIKRPTQDGYIACLVITPKHRAGYADVRAKVERNMGHKKCIQIAHELLSACGASAELLGKVHAMAPTIRVGRRRARRSQ